MEVLQEQNHQDRVIKEGLGEGEASRFLKPVSENSSWCGFHPHQVSGCLRNPLLSFSIKEKPRVLS